MMFLLQLGCAVSLFFGDVPVSDGRHADGLVDRHPSVLQLAGGGLEGFHPCGRGSMRRHETSCRPSGPVLSAALERAQLPNGQYLSAIQASHVD